MIQEKLRNTKLEEVKVTDTDNRTDNQFKTIEQIISSPVCPEIASVCDFLEEASLHATP